MSLHENFPFVPLIGESCSTRQLNSELAKVVIEMFVHPGTPLLWCERTEKGVRVLRTLRFAALVKSPDPVFELLPFPGEIPVIGYHKSLVSGTVPGKWLVISKCGADKSAEYSADEHPRQNDAAGGQVEGRGAVRHHLRGIHLAPLRSGCWLQVVDARDYFFSCLNLK